MQNKLPLFYASPEVLSFEKHRDLVLADSDDFSFAAAANAIPVTVGEFAASMRHYPIVFIQSGAHIGPVVLTALKQGRNLFLDQAGNWRQKTYVPAYVRRYPFITIQVSDSNEQVLGFDAECKRVRTADQCDGGAALFLEDGNAGPATEPMMKLCEAFSGSVAVSEAFTKALEAENLLVEKHAEITFADKNRYRLDGMLIVDEARFRKLDDATLCDWHRKGFTDAVIMHLASMQNWQTLLSLEEEDHADQAA